MTIEELQLREATRLYPPRFVIEIQGSNVVKDSALAFTFEGATEEIVKEVIFTKGIVWITILQVLRGEL